MPKFPIILYPKPVKEFLQSVEAETPNIPPEPVAPTLKNTARQPPVYQLNQIPLLQLVLVVNFLLLGGAIFKTNLPIWLLVLLVLSCSSTLLVFWQKISLGQFYKKSFLNPEASRLKEYELQLRVSKKILAQRIKLQQQSYKAVDTHRKKLYAQLAQSLMLPEGSSLAQQGASEEKFKHYLNRYFPLHIHHGFRLPIPGSELFYSTDFTYINKLINLYIDIEIDEPYYYKTKEPTHCCDQDKDKNRNTFFLKNNWIIIRFAEEQVVCYPNRCCQVLARVVAEITGDWELGNKFQEVPELPPIKHWTIREARKMARSNYRDRYLKSC